MVSPTIIRDRWGLRSYGVYSTAKRVFVVRAPIWMQVLFPGFLGIGAVLNISALLLLFLQTASMSSIVFTVLGILFFFIGLLFYSYKNSSLVALNDLEQRSVYQIEKGKISKIEFDRGDKYVGSKITIISSSGDHFVIYAKPATFDLIKRALSLVGPAASTQD